MRAKGPRPAQPNPAKRANQPSRPNRKSASPGRVAQLEAMVGKLRKTLVAEANAQARPAGRRGGQAGPRRRGQADVGFARAGVKARGANQARGNENHTLSRRGRRRWPRSRSCAPNCTRRAKRCAARRPNWRNSHVNRPPARARSCTAEGLAWSSIMILTWKACTTTIRSRTIRSRAKNADLAGRDIH